MINRPPAAEQPNVYRDIAERKSQLRRSAVSLLLIKYFAPPELRSSEEVQDL
jgi:hypothetical protein